MYFISYLMRNWKSSITATFGMDVDYTLLDRSSSVRITQSIPLDRRIRKKEKESNIDRTKVKNKKIHTQYRKWEYPRTKNIM
jgi:hypothetical protein